MGKYGQIAKKQAPKADWDFSGHDFWEDCPTIVAGDKPNQSRLVYPKVVGNRARRRQFLLDAMNGKEVGWR
jgi:hypothetical protein